VLFPTKRKKKIYSNMFTNHKYSWNYTYTIWLK
jgi:hypothetical protein